MEQRNGYRITLNILFVVLFNFESYFLEEKCLIDLVIWTLNSERYLEGVLSRATSVVPDNELGELILVDGGSSDNTVRIARGLGWKTFFSEPGIGVQANEALRHVKNEVFGSIEHDVLLADDWFSLMKCFDCWNIGVVQGIRLPTHPVLRAFDKEIYDFHHEKLWDYGISLDNNMYKTDVIRAVGGFPVDDAVCIDRGLRDRVNDAGFVWRIIPWVRSDHIRNNLWETMKHDYRLLGRVSRDDQLVNMGRVASVGKLPFRVVELLVHTGDPRVLAYVVAHKFVRVGAVLKRYDIVRRARNEN